MADPEAVMSFMMPVIFQLFSNITDINYKNTFHPPCEYDSLLGMFEKLPPYFNEIGKKYPDKIDLVAYYSMQMASGFLVSTGALTMDCLYKMLSLQTKLGDLAIGIMDHPEKHDTYVGKFGIFMKPYTKELRQNPMLKIIEYVDTYEKNTDESTIGLFGTFNVIFVIISLVGIVSNAFLLFTLSRMHIRSKSIRNGPPSTSSLLSSHINMRYAKTRLALCLITILHSFYLLINFIIMSQFKLAGLALGQLNESSVGCKLAFFLFPPTTAYNFLYQFAIWLLVYAIKVHHNKLREMKRLNYYDVLQCEEGTTQQQALMDQINGGVGGNDSRSKTKKQNKKNAKGGGASSSCTQSSSRRSVYACLMIMLLVVMYNIPNILFYSLNKVTVILSRPRDVQIQSNTVSYCAFDEAFAKYYSLINNKLIPALNLLLFNFLPLIICFTYILLDACFLVRLYREQQKIYEKLKEFIEWPLYAYFVVFSVTHLPFILHDLCDLIAGTNKFPFVFPLFIRMTFSNKVPLVIIENLLMCLAYASYFYIWLATDKLFRQLVCILFNKHVLCRSHNSCGGGGSSSNSTSGCSTTSGTSQIIKKSKTTSNVDVGCGDSGTSTTSSTRSTSKIDAIESVASNVHAISKLHSFQMIDTDTNDDELKGGGGGGGSNDYYQSYPYRPRQGNQQLINDNQEATYQNHQLLINPNDTNNTPMQIAPSMASPLPPPLPNHQRIYPYKE